MKAAQKQKLKRAWTKLEDQANACYSKQRTLENRAAADCPYAVGQLLQMHEHETGRRHWGYVQRIDGFINRSRVGWSVTIKNTRKNGVLIGGNFHFRDDTLNRREIKILTKV